MKLSRKSQQYTIWLKVIYNVKILVGGDVHSEIGLIVYYRPVGEDRR